MLKYIQMEEEVEKALARKINLNIEHMAWGTLFYKMVHEANFVDITDLPSQCQKAFLLSSFGC